MEAIPYEHPLQFLRYLHAQRFCDREIAEYLNDPPSYLLHNHPRVASPLHLLDKPDPPVKWSRRMVRRWRHKLGLKAHRAVRTDYASPQDVRACRRRHYARRWSECGLDLYPAQVDILDALFERGPQTMRGVFPGRRAPKLTGGRSAVAALVAAGLVVLLASVYEYGRLVRQYALAPGVAPRHDRRRPTGIDQQFRALNLIEDMTGRLPSPTGAPHTSRAKNFRDN